MTKRNKLLQRFLKSPVSVKYLQIENILIELGFEKIEAKGSHKKFKHVLLDSDLIIPVHNNDCKDFYKKQVAKFIMKYFQYDKTKK